MIQSIPIVAAATQSQVHIEDYSPAVIPAVIVAAVALILLALMKWVRKRVKQNDSPAPGGFTLSDLRQLVKEGKMTPEEFERAKTLVLGAHRRAQEIKPGVETISNKQTPRQS